MTQRTLPGRLTSRHRDEIVDNYLSGVDIPELARRYERSQVTIKRIIRQSGVNADSAHKPITQYDKDEIVTAYQNGVTISQLSKEYGRIPAVIRRILREQVPYNGPIPNRHVIYEPENQD